LKEVKIFEIGTVWKGGKEITMVGTVKGNNKKATNLDEVLNNSLIEWEEKPLEEYAKNVPEAGEPPLSAASRYQAFSKYPYIVRDVAFWTPAGADMKAIEQDIKKGAGELCVKASLFDQFQKGERTSYAFRLVFQSFERTLTEAEVNQIMEKVYASLKATGFDIR
jgi:hypothetical protein